MSDEKLDELRDNLRDAWEMHDGVTRTNVAEHADCATMADVTREVFCRAWDDGADVAMEEWRAWYKPGDWLWWGRGVGAFIYQRNKRLSEPRPAPAGGTTADERGRLAVERSAAWKAIINAHRWATDENIQAGIAALDALVAAALRAVPAERGQAGERCECGETTAIECGQRPSRHCGAWDNVASQAERGLEEDAEMDAAYHLHRAQRRSVVRGVINGFMGRTMPGGLTEQILDALRPVPDEASPGEREDGKASRRDLVGGEGPAIPREQYEAALKGSGCIEIYDPKIDDFRLYDVTTPEGVGAVVTELAGRMFRAAVSANLSALGASAGPHPQEEK